MRKIVLEKYIIDLKYGECITSNDSLEVFKIFKELKENTPEDIKSLTKYIYTKDIYEKGDEVDGKSVEEMNTYSCYELVKKESICLEGQDVNNLKLGNPTLCVDGSNYNNDKVYELVKAFNTIEIEDLPLFTDKNSYFVACRGKYYIVTKEVYNKVLRLKK